MRVLHYCQSFSLISETFIYDYVTELESQGVANHVVTNNRVNQGSRPFPKVHVVEYPSRWDPFRVYHRLRLHGEPQATRISFWSQLRNRLKTVVRRVSPDLIHAHFGPAGVLMIPVASELRVPLVTHFHGYDISKLVRDEFWRRQYKMFFKKANASIGVSNHICSRLRQLGAPEGKVRLLHGGIRLNKFPYDPPSTRYDRTKVRCLHVGRLVEKKSPLKLVRAFAKAQEQTRGKIGLELVIAGDGPLRKPVDRLIYHLGLEESVRCIGAVPHDVVVRLMRESELYTQYCETASDGDQEGQGITFVEASSVGLPIVTTRHNGIPDVVIDGATGYLVEEGDVNGMAERIAYLALQPQEWDRMSRSGRRHVEEKFDLSIQTGKLRELYSEVASQA